MSINTNTTKKRPRSSTLTSTTLRSKGMPLIPHGGLEKGMRSKCRVDEAKRIHHFSGRQEMTGKFPLFCVPDIKSGGYGVKRRTPLSTLPKTKIREYP